MTEFDVAARELDQALDSMGRHLKEAAKRSAMAGILRAEVASLKAENIALLAELAKYKQEQEDNASFAAGHAKMIEILKGQEGTNDDRTN